MFATRAKAMCNAQENLRFQGFSRIGRRQVPVRGLGWLVSGMRSEPSQRC